MNRRDFLTNFGAIAVLAGCGGDSTVESAKNSYALENLAATDIKYKAKFTLPKMVDAWGISIRPAGAGGHFWVTGGGTSWQFLGDVRRSPDAALQSLSQDALTEVFLPGADSEVDDSSIGKATGVVFNGAPIASDNFVVPEQSVTDAGIPKTLAGSARFIFVTDSGVVSAWTEREKSTGATVRKNGPCTQMYDGSEDGMQFFGCAINAGTWNKLWLADFGDKPQIRTLNEKWELVPTQGFVNPFATGALRDPANAALGKIAKPGDPVPFNIQEIAGKVYVAFAISKADEADQSRFDAGEEDALDVTEETKSNGRPNKGKLVEYGVDGSLTRVFEDDGRLNAPWGVALAPQDFGPLSNRLLVGNFGGAGKIAAYDTNSGRFVDFLRDEAGKEVAIEGLWALLFGNGASLGDSNALYFAAGPAEEKEGLFGVIRHEK
jgi:uncharacterized protein (TIGR03118 family)